MKLSLKLIKQNWFLYVFLLPAIVYTAVFFYAPMYGILLAFKDFVPSEGIMGSAFSTPLFQHFTTFFSSYQFWPMVKNTLTLSIYQLLAGFPMPIILALLLTYTCNSKLKKVTQIVTYAPHFISTVVMVGMLLVVLSPSGILNQLLSMVGFDPVLFMGKPNYFKHIYVWSGVWQSMGWGSIIYISALTSVSPELHEAAIVDGANKLQRIWNIDIPSILPTAMILLILNMGTVLNVGFEKVFLMQNDVNLEVSEIISTYVYKVGLISAQYSYSTAIGLFNNVVSFVLLITVNKVCKKTSGTSLW